MHRDHRKVSSRKRCALASFPPIVLTMSCAPFTAALHREVAIARAGAICGLLLLLLRPARS
jgi:uncharacterized membrane protein